MVDNKQCLHNATCLLKFVRVNNLMFWRTQTDISKIEGKTTHGRERMGMQCYNDKFRSKCLVTKM